MLVIDDVPANLVAMEVALAPLERQVITAVSGKEGLAYLLERDFSLLLLDVQMPEMDGLETASLIRSRERTKHLPIIFVTAYRDDRDCVRKAYQLGAVDFMFKPIEPEVLLAKASVFVRLQDQAEQLAAGRLQRDFEEKRRRYETQALRRQMEQEQAAKHQLSCLNRALAEADRRKDSFLAILAHELRNPLAPIRTAIDLMKEHPERLHGSKTIDILDRQTHQLARMVDDLLDISRIKANKTDLRRDIHDLRDIVDTALATSAPWIAERRHQLSVSLPDEPMHILADHVRVTQIITNLINNAARYTEPGGFIAVTGTIDGEHARIQVTDSGIGIAPALLDKIFEMFVQERVRADGSGGLGLGLALAKHLVELHAGTIHAYSDGRGTGSRFEITLPIADPAERPVATIRSLARAATTALRAVVVDDDADMRELLAELLRAHGHDVTTASHGNDGLVLIREHRPDVALVDLALPGMDGLALARSLRDSSPDIMTRLIALTGSGQPTDFERTRAAGFDAHLVKPASEAAILESLVRR
ncbi:MAG TPA: response regulator [Kofleriaceae bacterium]|nr:response regulator [Kofleriaceae bacterium]